MILRQRCKLADKYEPKPSPNPKSDLKPKPGPKKPKIRLDLKICSVIAGNESTRC